MTISFHIQMDDQEIENPGKFVMALDHVITSLLNDDEREAIDISTTDVDEEDGDNLNFVNISLLDTKNDAYLAKYKYIFNMLMSLMSHPDPNVVGYIP